MPDDETLYAKRGRAAWPWILKLAKNAICRIVEGGNFGFVSAHPVKEVLAEAAPIEARRRIVGGAPRPRPSTVGKHAGGSDGLGMLLFPSGAHEVPDILRNLG